MADFRAYVVEDAAGDEHICFVAAAENEVGVLRQLVNGAKKAFPVDEDRLKVELAKLSGNANADETLAAYKAAILPKAIDLSTNEVA